MKLVYVPILSMLYDLCSRCCILLFPDVTEYKRSYKGLRMRFKPSLALSRPFARLEDNRLTGRGQKTTRQNKRKGEEDAC